MNRVFLGRPVHWLIIAALVAAGWIGGRMRLHVSEFNPFLIFLIVVTVAVVLTVLKTSPRGQDVTRDPIVEHEDHDASA